MSHTEWYVYDLCILNQSINYFGQKRTFFSASKVIFQRFYFTSQPGLKCRYVFQLRTEVQFYKVVNVKSLKNKAFSPDTEVIKQEKVIEMLDKLIMLNCGQIMLSKSENLITLCKHLLSILSCSSVFFNCMFSLIVLSIL